jgi:sugar phosphate permease
MTPAEKVTRPDGPLSVPPFPPAALSWFVWGISAVFYLGVFFLRTAPAVMTSELMRDFHIGAASLGNLSAFYFYAYVAMQIPVGVLTSSMGARKLLTIGAITAGLGTFLFGTADNFVLACAGRAIVGGATAVGWLVLLRLAAHWFPSRNFGMVSGLGLFFGNLGAVFAQVPLRLAVEHFTWRETILGSATITLILGVLAWVTVRDDPGEKGFRSHAPDQLQRHQKASIAGAFRALGSVFSYKNPWLILIAQGGMVGSIMTFTVLWGAPFLKARFGLQPKSAATICSVMIIFWAVASPVFGAISDKIGKRKPAYLAGSLVCASGWASMFYIDGLSLAAFTVIATITSVATGCVIIAFAYGRESVPVQHMGTVTASTNIGNMLGNVLLQPGIGWVLDRNWAGETVKGAHVYGVQAYQAGFALIVAWSVLSVVMILLTRETDCKQSA